MKLIVAICLIFLVTACTVTQKESDAVQAATAASQQAEINSLQQTIDTRSYIDVQITRAFGQIKEMMLLWSAERRPHAVKQ